MKVCVSFISVHISFQRSTDAVLSAALFVTVL